MSLTIISVAAGNSWDLYPQGVINPVTSSVLVARV